MINRFSAGIRSSEQHLLLFTSLDQRRLNQRHVVLFGLVNDGVNGVYVNEGLLEA